jgi:hypothetical protein
LNLSRNWCAWGFVVLGMPVGGRWLARGRPGTTMSTRPKTRSLGHGSQSPGQVAAAWFPVWFAIRGQSRDEGDLIRKDENGRRQPRDPKSRPSPSLRQLGSRCSADRGQPTMSTRPKVRALGHGRQSPCQAAAVRVSKWHFRESLPCPRGPKAGPWDTGGGPLARLRQFGSRSDLQSGDSPVMRETSSARMKMDASSGTVTVGGAVCEGR